MNDQPSVARTAKNAALFVFAMTVNLLLLGLVGWFFYPFFQAAFRMVGLG